MIQFVTISLSYFDYLLDHERNVRSVHQDIITQREAFKLWIKEIFPLKKVYNSKTNFVTFKMQSASQANYVVKMLKKEGFIIKLLSLHNHAKDLVRISITEKSVMDALKKKLMNLTIYETI
jgi:histidinol-phosphate/aromatic aminotransferase/cobyric acid decarboxylase-like protein